MSRRHLHSCWQDEFFYRSGNSITNACIAHICSSNFLEHSSFGVWCVQHLLHGVLRAGAACHNALTQAAQIIVCKLRKSQLSNEHGGHSVQGCALFLLHCLHASQLVIPLNNTKKKSANCMGQQRQVAAWLPSCYVRSVSPVKRYTSNCRLSIHSNGVLPSSQLIDQEAI